jgi:tetratricopeptide (TPR) repeat protein
MNTPTSPDQAKAARRLFDVLVGRSPDEQKGRLAALEDPVLRREVEGLLEAYDKGDPDAGGRLVALEELRARLAGPETGLETGLGPDAGAPGDLEAGGLDPEDPLGLNGKEVGRYEVGSYLGGGGMGVVYRARDPRLDRTVALKFLPPNLSRAETARRRFIREAKAASALDHPNIATVHEIGETERRVGEVGAGQLFIAMTYYTGETLKATLAREGPLPVEEAVGYAIQIAEGLGAAHRAGLVHRDVKPANVIVTEGGTAKLVDFGLARAAGPSDLTRTGRALGTAAYMSPEQARGEAVGAPSDLWSLGVLLYELLAGERPFRGSRPGTVIYSILNEKPTPLGEKRPEVPRALAAVVEGCLAKDPAERYPDTEALLQALRARAAEASQTPLIPGRVLTAVAFLTRLPRRWTFGAVAALLSLGVAYGLTAGLGMGPFTAFLAPDVLGENDRVVLADFATQTVDSTLAYAVTDAFRVDLSQSGVVELAGRAVVTAALGRMERRPGAHLDFETAREVARREGVKAVVDGEINAVGAGFVLSARLVGAESGEELLALRETAPGEDAVIPAIERLSRRLREQMGESMESIRETPPLSRVRTASLEALMRVTAGYRATTTEGRGQCVPLATEAIAIDSLFATAFMLRGVCHSNMGTHPSQTYADYRKALELRDRLTDHHRAVMEQLYYGFTGEYEKAIEAIEAYMGLYPEDDGHLNNLSFMYADLGHLVQAEEILRRRFEGEQPLTNMHWSNLAHHQINQGKLAEAEETLRRWEEWGRWEEAPWTVLLRRADIAVARGQYEAAEAHVRKLKKRESGNRHLQLLTSTFLGHLASVRGALTEAEAHFRDVMELSEKRNDIYNYYLNAQSIAHAHLWVGGDSARAQKTLDESLDKHPLHAVEPLNRAYPEFAISYAQIGRPIRARAFLGEYRDSIPREIHGRHRDQITVVAPGWVAVAEGRLEDAASLFGRWVEHESPWRQINRRFALGLIYDRMEEPDSAIAYYERYLAIPQVGGVRHRVRETGWRARVLERLGQLYEAQGNAEKAAWHYTRFVALWEDCDPELKPRVEAARAALIRLPAEASG